MPANSEIEKLERRWRENPKGTVFAPYAEVLRKNGDHQLARDVLRQGLELHPDHIPGNIVLGRCCLDLGEDGPAEGAFSHVLELDPENVIALKALAEITERQGRLAEATGWLTRLVAVDPSNDEARDQLQRVGAARESAAAALTAEAAPGAPADAESGPTGGPVTEATLPPPAASAAGEVLDEPPPPAERFTPQGRVLPEDDQAEATPGVESEPVPLVPPTEPAPVLDLEVAEFDATGAESTPAPEGLMPETRFAEPPERAEAPAPAPPGGTAGTPGQAPDLEVFSFGVEESPSIDIRASGKSEFQTPDASEDLLGLSAGKSEFQVPDDSSSLLGRSTGTSEYQSPDDSQELAIRAGSSEYQTPSGSEELLDRPAEEPAAETADEAQSGVTETQAAMAALPTQELSTAFEPGKSAPDRAPTEERDEQPAAAPQAQQPEPEPAPVEEPEPVDEEPVARTTADLKIIFPDDAAEPEPPRVRRLTEELAASSEAAEVPMGEPEPVMTESMAELYVRQGHHAEALRVYRALLTRQPNDPRLKDKVRALEADSPPPRRLTYAALETGGESVESFFRTLADARPGSDQPVPDWNPAEDARGGAPTRPARDPLSLSAIFGEEPAPAPRNPEPAPEADAKPAAGDAFSFDQFFGGATPPGGSGGGHPPAGRPDGVSDEDLDQFQHWLKSLKR